MPDRQSLPDGIDTVAVAALLIPTARGHAMVMLVVAKLGLAVTLIRMRTHAARDGALTAAVGSAVAIGLALTLAWR